VKHNMFIFYHLFLINKWEEIFVYHLSKVVDSGFYDEIEEMHLGIIFKSKRKLKRAKEIIADYKKIKILYARKYDSKPITVWKKIKTETQLGEGETIFKMIRFAKTQKDEAIYLFFHSKGVTDPRYHKRQDTLSYFCKKGLTTTTDNRKVTEFLLKDMCYETVEKWKTNVKILENKEFYNYIWSFFWAKGAMLKRFKFKNYVKYQKSRGYRLNKRHFVGNFIINLYGTYGEDLIGNNTEKEIINLIGISR